MADQELLIVVRMRDEASAVLKQTMSAIRDLGGAYDDAAKKAVSFNGTLQTATATTTKLSQASSTAGQGFASMFQTLTRAGAASGLLGNAMQTAATRTGALGQAGNAAGGRLTTLFQGLRGMAGPAQIALAALEPLIVLYGKAIDRTIQYEKSQNALNSAMKFSGGAIGMTKGAVNDAVNETASRTRTDDQELRNAAALLINQGEATSGTFKEALDVSTKLAFVMGTDVVSASRLVAKAMVDPKQGMEALRDAGIKLKAAEMDRIEAMARSGDKAGAVAELLRAVRRETGSAEGATKGLSGAFKNLSHASGEFLNQFNDSALSRITTGIVNVAAGAVRAATIFEKKDTVKFLAQVEKQLAQLEERRRTKGFLTRDEEAAAQGFERKIKELKAQLVQASDEAARAVQQSIEIQKEQVGVAIRSELEKNDLVINKTGEITSKQAVKADEYVEYLTKLRDAAKKNYEEIARLAEAGDESAERYRQSTEELRAAERLLAEARTAAARAMPEGIAAIAVAEAELARTRQESAKKAEDTRRSAEAGHLEESKKAEATKQATATLAGLDTQLTDVSKVLGDVNREMPHFVAWLEKLRDQIKLPANPNAGVSDGKRSGDACDASTGSRGNACQGSSVTGSAKLTGAASISPQEASGAVFVADVMAQTERLKELAAAAGDAAKQKSILLDMDIAKAQRNVAPAWWGRIDEVMRERAAAEQLRQEADKAAKEEQGKIEKATAFARETFKGFFSDLKDGLKKGQGLWEAFGNAARNALNKITEKIVDLVSNKLLDQLFDGLGNVLGGSGGGKGGAGGGGGGIMGAIGQGLRWIATALFADGGIMTSRGPVPLRKYSGGGIATSPQLALFGEGSVPEAYVPVPSGRIPVELRGGGLRGGMTVQTNVNVNMTAPAGGQGSGDSGGRGNMMEQARELGAIVTAMVNKNLQDQMRPGGLLNPSGSFSAGVVQ